jgi:AmmeMemoRadiSam system protein A
MLLLSENDQQTLLRMAREALGAHFDRTELPAVPDPGEALLQRCGAFVTLHRGKNLRGCVGVIEAQKALYLTVRECAVWAAVSDSRFPPVMKQEVRGLTLEISVLSPLEEIAPENVEVGRHGLLISRGFYRGLLLPQVATEWKWDREQFLEETCHKAGLPANAWREGARIQAFTAQVFNESHPANSSTLVA